MSLSITCVSTIFHKIQMVFLFTDGHVAQEGM